MTPSLKQIEELIGRLEAASGPDRELDARIEVTRRNFLFGAAAVTAVASLDMPGWLVIGKDLQPAPAYTASIDAALTLVPEGFRWRVERYNIDETKCRAELAEVGQIINAGMDYGIGIKCRAQASASTPALALCVAALRARLAILSKEEE